MQPKPLIHSLTKDQLIAVCRELGQPPYRAAQLWHWLYARRAADWTAMKNLPAGFRQALADRLTLESVRLVRVSGESRALATRKLLLGLCDGECIETVLIPAKDRNTVCVSTQVGCKFKCAFCASGQLGFTRNLETGEMVGQVLAAARECGAAPTHVVFMGMGEPLDNYEPVMAAVRLINDAQGLNIGARRITISTCGLVPGIRRLAREGLQVELSISLHAVTDAVRSRLMPVNRAYPLQPLLEACRDYTAQTKRIITFEYTLIQGVNDSAEDAAALARLLKPVRGRVNLIPLNPVQEFVGLASPRATADLFVKILERAGVNATVRASRGAGLDAACGQLRRRHLKEL